MKLFIKKPNPKVGLHAHQWLPAKCKKKASVEEALRWPPNKFHVFEEKWDGVRFFLQVRPNHSTINYLTSRHLSKKTGRYTEEHRIKKITQHKFASHLDDTIFDGELTGKGISSDVAHHRTTGEVKFRVFDIVRHRGQDVRDLPWSERRALLVKLSPEFPEEWMKLTPVASNGRKLLKAVLQRKGEGVVRKHRDKPYGVDWWKVKKQETADVVIYGFLDTKSHTYKEKGWIGALLFGQYIEFKDRAEYERMVKKFNSRIIKADFKSTAKRMGRALVAFGRCDGFSQKLRAEISKNKEDFRDRVMEIKFQERLASGYFRSPKFLRFRNDKNSEQCTYGN